MKIRKVPVINRGPDSLDLGIEPEGDCITLAAGENVEVRYMVAEHDEEPIIELELEGRLLSLHCMARKEVWRGGSRLR